MAKMFYKSFTLGSFLIFTLMLCSLADAGLTVVYGDWPPYTYKDDNGQDTGFCLEMVMETLARMDADVDELKLLPWARAIKELEQGQADIVIAASKTPKRLKQFYFSKNELGIVAWVLFAMKDRSDLKFSDWDDLRGYSLGVAREYIYHDKFVKYYQSNMTYEEVGSDKDLFKLLYAGRVDYIVGELYNGRYWAESLGIAENVKDFADNPINYNEYYAMFSRKTVTAEFVRQFDEALLEFKNSEDYQILKDGYSME